MSDDGIQQALTSAVDSGHVVGVSASAWSRQELLFEGAAGTASPSQPMQANTIFWTASMTKAVTAVAVMQLVEGGRISLDAPAGDIIPFLDRVRVLAGFDGNGDPQFRPPIRRVTLRHLLTHTSGFGYEFNNESLLRFIPTMLIDVNNPSSKREHPLTFDPGDSWQYGIGIEWAGRVAEEVSGLPLEQLFRKYIFEPLEMSETTYFPNGDQRDRCAVMQRRVNGVLIPDPLPFPDHAEAPRGGGGLYSTVIDYARFTRMLLHGGTLEGSRVLMSDTVEAMSRNQLGNLTAPGWKSCDLTKSNDVALFPGMRTGWGISFLINLERSREGRAPLSLSWAGLANSFFWVDHSSGVTGVFATQILPFFDSGALTAFKDFERAVYAVVGDGKSSRTIDKFPR